MNTFPTLSKIMEEPTSEMFDHFRTRTNEHINLVEKNLYLLEGYRDLDFDTLEDRAENHDYTKYSKELYLPYVWLSWMHKCKNEGVPFQYPPGVEAKVREATGKHVHTEPHHPEAHADINEMSDLDIIEATCDWTAMSQELGENGGSAKSWADKNVGTKWAFNPEQTKLIYETIQELDQRKADENL